MRELIRRILGRPVGVLVASIAVLVMGVISFFNIPLQLLPEGFEERSISVRVNLRDSSPEEAERHVAIPIEESLGTVSGIEAIASRCDRGTVRIDIEMKKDADAAAVERDVRDRIRRVEPDLPDDVDRIRVRRQGSSDRPVLFYALTANTSRVELSDFMEDVMLPRLEAIDGVARASAWGNLRRSVRIWLDPQEVARRQLNLRDLLQRMRADNMATDLGDVTEGGRTAYVRATMEFDNLQQIKDYPIAEGVKLGDIARVEIVKGLDQGWSRYNGNAVIVGTVYKMSGANTVETCRDARAQFERILADHPEIDQLHIRAFFDQGKVIENSLKTLYKNALYGGLLAVVILALFFRRLRMTLLVAAAIPLSLTIAVTVLYLGGSSLNIATMMGLTLAVGMLIDNAIVVVEAILRRRELGDEPRDAAARGTGEVALAVLTATLTTIVVFAPVIFLSDSTMVRLWLGNIGGPIAFALVGSLGVALVLVPLGSIHLRRRSHAHDVRPRQEGERSAWFGRILGAALEQRFVVVVGSILLVASVTFPYERLSRKGTMGRGGGPVRIALRFPRHYTMRDADNAIKQYEAYVAKVKDRLGLRGIYARFDRYGGMVMCWQGDDATVSKDDVRDEFKRDFPKIEGVWRSLESMGMGGETTITLEGEDAGLLEATLDRIEARLESLPSVAETSRERGAGLQELQVTMDQDAIAQGKVVPDQVRGMIGWVVRGARLRDFKSEGRDLPLLIEFDPDFNVEVADLANLLIPTDAGMRPLGSLTRTRIRSSSSTIERREGRRVAQMKIVGNKDDDREFHKDVQAALAGAQLPPGVRFKVGGSWEDLQQSFDALFDALLLAGVLVFLLTGVLFEDLLLPLAVMVAAVPAMAGAVWALYIAGKPMDELSYLGVILLIGVVVNNGIVLIDRAQQRRREGLPLRAAVRAAGSDRVRPVIMTAVTTIVGLLPMAVFKGGNDEIPYDTLATAVIGGLVFATIVTLLLVPVVFTLLVDVTEFIKRHWKRALSFARAS